MPESFFLGVMFALLLVAIGVLAGSLLRRFLWPLSNELESTAELHPVVARLKSFTSDFSQDVSEFRSVIDAAVERARVLNGPGTSKNGQAGASSELLAQIVEANEHLRRRLEEAEASLQCRSDELNAYITEARTDALTGMPNRRAFDDELNRRMALYRRQGTPFGVLLLDVDRFKSINDRFGHPIGDEVLKTVADALRNAVRDCDLMARYGGEEFGVLLAGASRDEFVAAAERVRRTVEHAPIVCSGVKVNVTVSCGVAEAAGGEDAASLVRRADEALYASKSGGRNCSHWHDGRGPMRVTPAESGDQAGCYPQCSETVASATFRDVCAELRRKLTDLTRR